MSGTWQVTLTVPKGDVPAVEDQLIALAPVDAPPSLSSFEVEADPTHWRVDAWFTDEPDADLLAAALTGHDFTCAASPEVDWVAQALEHHHEVRAGRFHIYASHHEAPPPGGVRLKVDASLAFGTGQHETTLGCLRAIDLLGKQMKPTRPLDLGCGTGILAMALAHITPGAVIASDIDPQSLVITRHNAMQNRLGPRLKHVEAAGLAHDALRRAAPYDMIVANILAGPLCAMATQLSRAVRPGGWLVLSGLLASQERLVRLTYRNRGLVLRHRFVIGEWCTLVLQNKP